MVGPDIYGPLTYAWSVEQLAEKTGLPWVMAMRHVAGNIMFLHDQAVPSDIPIILEFLAPTVEDESAKDKLLGLYGYALHRREFIRDVPEDWRLMYFTMWQLTALLAHRPDAAEIDTPAYQPYVYDYLSERVPAVAFHAVAFKTRHLADRADDWVWRQTSLRADVAPVAATGTQAVGLPQELRVQLAAVGVDRVGLPDSWDTKFSWLPQAWPVLLGAVTSDMEPNLLEAILRLVAFPDAAGPANGKIVQLLRSMPEWLENTESTLAWTLGRAAGMHVNVQDAQWVNEVLRDPRYGSARLGLIHCITINDVKGLTPTLVELMDEPFMAVDAMCKLSEVTAGREKKLLGSGLLRRGLADQALARVLSFKDHPGPVIPLVASAFAKRIEAVK